MKLRLVLLVTIGSFSARFCKYKEMKIHHHNAGHMTKMAALLMYGKTL